MKMFAFLETYHNPSTIISVLQQHGLLRQTLHCQNCENEMQYQKADSRDGIRFECSLRSCRKKRTIRFGSFFEHVKLSLCDSMLLLHLWARGCSEKYVCDDYSFSKQTVVDWFRFGRDLCVYHFENSHDLIGGENSTVEIDETHVVKRKNNVGRILASGWLVGGIERRTDGEFRSFFRLVYNRSGPHLKHIIREHVSVGTHIITDGWAGYSGLSEMGYRHSVVIHEETFVSPTDSNVHTQRIESTWGSMKRFLRAHGTNKGEYLTEYICEYIFRRMYDDVFEHILEVIRRKYTF